MGSGVDGLRQGLRRCLPTFAAEIAALPFPKRPVDRRTILNVLLGILISSALSSAKGASPVAPPNAVAFPLRDVRLLDGPLKHSQDIAGAYLLSLDADRLIARFRKEAGLEKKAENYPGWEEKQLPGVGLSFYLSGCSKLYATTGDERYRERLEYILSELDACQQANGDGYLLATLDGKRIFKEIESGNIRWEGGWMLNGEAEPYYAMEKLFSGLRDAYRYAGSAKALEIEVRLGDWLEKHMSHLNEQQMNTLIQCEYGGMNWALSDLYADTGDARYLALSKRWHDKTIEDPLCAGQDCLPGKHANTQFPKISGCAARYPYTGDTADRVTAQFFWDRVVNHHSYVTGGNSENEHFGPPDKLSDRLSPTDTELCNSYNMIRLTQLLFYIQPRAEYAEYAERVLFNHILAAQHPADGRICYFTPLAPGCARRYETLYDGFTCCTCSSLDSYSKHAEFIYAHDANALYVNLFAASEVNWREKGVSIRQDTKFPDEDAARFTIACGQPTDFTLYLRCPVWSVDGTSISLNGERQNVAARSGGYASIKRVWNDGDNVELRFPMSLRMEAMPDNPKKIAFFYGPILLAAPVDEANDDVLPPALVPTAEKPLADAIVPVQGKSLEFTMTGVAKPNDLPMMPFFRLHDRPYVVYWDVMSEADYAKRQEENAARIAEREALNARTADSVKIGDDASESAHAMKGENTQSGFGAYGQHMKTRWRHAGSGGYFSYELAVLPGQPNALRCTYWGKETGSRTFDILVNGIAVATQTLDSNHPSEFYNVETQIPAELTKDAFKITVTFKPHDGNTAGGLFGIRTVK